MRKWLSKNKSVVEFSHGYMAPSDCAWLILKNYLERMATNVEYRVVLDVFLGFRAHLPTWFINSYKVFYVAHLIQGVHICRLTRYFSSLNISGDFLIL